MTHGESCEVCGEWPSRVWRFRGGLWICEPCRLEIIDAEPWETREDGVVPLRAALAAPVGEGQAAPTESCAPAAGPSAGDGPGSNTGHGHVWSRPDGLKMRCGGPGRCAVCSKDAAQYGPKAPAAHPVGLQAEPVAFGRAVGALCMAAMQQDWDGARDAMQTIRVTFPDGEPYAQPRDAAQERPAERAQVPREPTEAVLEAALLASRKHGDIEAGVGNALPVNYEFYAARLVWTAMHDAATGATP